MTRQNTTLTRRLTPTTSPLSTGLLQRQCACGQRTIAGGEYEACQKGQSPLQRRSVKAISPSEVPLIVHEVLRSSSYSLDSDTRTFIESRFNHDFSGVQVHTSPRENIQPELVASQQIDRDRAQANQARALGESNEVSLPALGEEEGIADLVQKPSEKVTTNQTQVKFNIVNLPQINDINGEGGSSSPSSSTGGVGGHCDQPLSMDKVISGTFQGGKSMGDYFPDLVGRGFWQHGSTGGPWDTGSRVGANAQLVGTFPIPCRSALYSLAQTVTYTRAIFNGVRHPKEGVVQDDIAKSGRDASRPPFRQEWFNVISMADPPSVSYSATSNIEFDRSFVTSLVGPGGRRSVSWSTSIRVVNGRVTRNTIS